MKKLQAIYLIEFNNGVKFGRSHNLYQRLKEYENPWCRPILGTYVVETEYSIEVERKLKQHFKSNINDKSLEFISNVEIHEIINKLYEFSQEIVVNWNTKPKYKKYKSEPLTEADLRKLYPWEYE